MSADRPQPSPAEHVLQIATGYILSSALQVAAQLNLADHLAAGPRTAADLAHAAGAHADAVYRILRILAMVGIFDEVSPRTFALTPAADVLRKDHPQSVRDMAEWMSEPMHMRVYADIMHSAKTGQPAADHALGMPVFEYFRANSGVSDLFNRAMTNFSAAVIPAVLEAYDFSGIDLLVDVAGGHGHVLMSILQTYPRMRGVLMDVDHVIAGAQPKIAAAGLSDRCEAVVADFFASVPGGGDAYIMKHIIHDWDDERALTILHNIHTAQEGKASAKVILLEAVIEPGNAPDLGKIIDVEMLIMPGGRERTADEFKALFDRAGYNLTRIVPTQSPLKVIEAARR